MTIGKRIRTSVAILASLLSFAGGVVFSTWIVITKGGVVCASGTINDGSSAVYKTVVDSCVTPG